MKWEYWVTDTMHGTDKIQEILDGLGLLGWELVAVSAFTRTQYLYFKRPLRKMRMPPYVAANV